MFKSMLFVNFSFDNRIKYIYNMLHKFSYFTCFDSNREGLLGAYNSKVTFSLSLMMSSSIAHRPFKFDDNIVRESRNLKRIVGNDGK
jgi:hypothetical protein